MLNVTQVGLVARLGAVLVLTACGAGASAGRPAPGDEAVVPAAPLAFDAPTPPGTPGRGGTVFNATMLAEARRPLLDLLRQRISGMQVRQSVNCPDVILRGRSTFNTPSSPTIYVDGMASNNTCVLQDLNTADLAQVEVYPNGITGRPGYRIHPYGVILIFMRQP